VGDVFGRIIFDMMMLFWIMKIINLDKRFKVTIAEQLIRAPYKFT
jgi:hypothetical protein